MIERGKPKARLWLYVGGTVNLDYRVKEIRS